MARAEILTVPKPGWDAEYLEDTGHQRLILEQYDREHVALLRYLGFLGIDPDTGQEIVQESFLKLHEHLLSGGDRSNLRAWLYRVCHNLARNIQASFRVSRTDRLPEPDDGFQLASDTPSAEDKLIDSERHRLYRSALQQLSRSQRECLLLRTQGMKYREISEILNLSVSTVGENITRGLERLKELV